MVKQKEIVMYIVVIAMPEQSDLCIMIMQNRDIFMRKL